MDVKRKTFSVTNKKNITVNPNNTSIKRITMALNENFSMSEELAKAIGTVVVQALTENAKDEQTALDIGDDLDLGEEGIEDLPESSRDAGTAEEVEGPKAAQDLSQDFAELKKAYNNHSEKGDDSRYKKVLAYFSKGV